jgi:hypothetical protein
VNRTDPALGSAVRPTAPLLVSQIGTRRGYVTERLLLRPGSEVALTVTPLIRQTLGSVY